MNGLAIRRFCYGVLLAISVAGCQPELKTEYATSRTASINGISTFIELMKQDDRRVDVWPFVTSRLADRYDTLVVFHTTFGPLNPDTKRELRELLSYGTIDRLILVLRDSDAAIDYWDQVSERKDLKQEDIQEARRAMLQTLNGFAFASQSDVVREEEDWYGLKTVKRNSSSEPIAVQSTLSTSPEKQPIKARWRLNRRLEAPEDGTVLWTSGPDPLLIQQSWFGIDVLVMASAAPLVNGGLVDSGNRSLATEIVDLVPAKSRVAIVTSSRWFKGEGKSSPGIMTFLQVQPYPWIFGQAVLAMLIYCWYRSPIFGCPRSFDEFETLRFGKHVDALGTLLARTGDVTYARLRVRDWLQGSGSSHLNTSDNDQHKRLSQEN